MSFPNIPNIDPKITIHREDSVNLLLASIALEELSLSHILNTEAEKIQYILGTLEGHLPPQPATFTDVLKINRSADNVLRDVIKKEILLQFELEDVMGILSASTTTCSTTTCSTTTSSTTTATTTSHHP